MLRGKAQRPRYYEPASVEEGDLIRVSWEDRGIEHSRTGRVYRIVREGTALAFFTKDGAEIMHWIHGVKRNAKVVLLEHAMLDTTDVLDLFKEEMNA